MLTAQRTVKIYSQNLKIVLVLLYYYLISIREVRKERGFRHKVCFCGVFAVRVVFLFHSGFDICGQ